MCRHGGGRTAELTRSHGSGVFASGSRRRGRPSRTGGGTGRRPGRYRATARRSAPWRSGRTRTRSARWARLPPPRPPRPGRGAPAYRVWTPGPRYRMHTSPPRMWGSGGRRGSVTSFPDAAMTRIWPERLPSPLNSGSGALRRVPPVAPGAGRCHRAPRSVDAASSAQRMRVSPGAARTPPSSASYRRGTWSPRLNRPPAFPRRGRPRPARRSGSETGPVPPETNTGAPSGR